MDTFQAALRWVLYALQAVIGAAWTRDWRIGTGDWQSGRGKRDSGLGTSDRQSGKPIAESRAKRTQLGMRKWERGTWSWTTARSAFARRDAMARDGPAIVPSASVLPN